LSKYVKFIALVWLFSTGTVVAEPTSPANTVLKYYAASREGNVAEMKPLIAGSFYNRRKALLEKNDGYPDFLKSHYQDSEVVINNVNISNEGKVAVVSVQITYASQDTETTKLILKKDKNNNWVIVDKLFD